MFLCLFLTKINLYPSVVLFSFPSLESWGSSFYLGQNLVWGSHLTKTHSFLWVIFPYSQNCERFQSCWWLFLSSVITPLLSCEAFCLGGSPDCTVSLSQSSVSCLLATHCVWDMFFSLRVLFLVFCLYSWFSHPLPLWLLCSLTFLLSRRHRHLPVSLQLLRWDCASQCGAGVLGLSVERRSLFQLLCFRVHCHAFQVTFIEHWELQEHACFVEMTYNQTDLDY